MRIIDNLWQVGGGDLTAPQDAAAYLVCFGDSAALIDAGCGAEHSRLKSNIMACLPDRAKIEYLFLTHCHFDHTGGAEAVRKDLECKIVAHSLDAIYLKSGDSEVTAASWYGLQMKPLNPDIWLSGEENYIQVGNGQIVAIHWPGHSPGSVVYMTQIHGQRILFGQDVHGPIHPALLSDETDYQTSLRKILELDADILCEGHFGVFYGKERVNCTC